MSVIVGSTATARYPKLLAWFLKLQVWWQRPISGNPKSLDSFAPTFLFKTQNVMMVNPEIASLAVTATAKSDLWVRKITGYQGYGDVQQQLNCFHTHVFRKTLAISQKLILPNIVGVPSFGRTLSRNVGLILGHQMLKLKTWSLIQ